VPTPPSTTNYRVGGHKVILGGIDLGNIPDISIRPQATILDHFTRRSGARILDKQAVTEKRLSFTIKLDEHAVEVYQKYFMATRAGLVLNPLKQPLAETNITATYLDESGNIWTYSHSRAITHPTNPMAFGTGTAWAEFEIDAEILYDAAAVGAEMGTLTLVS